jgi:hypothetical protein
MTWVVTATSLNVRSEPRVAPSNRLATLPNGHEVSKIEDAGAGWWKITTVLGGARLEGFVASQFLAQADQGAPPAVSGLNAVHMEENRPSVTRDAASGRAFPLGEPSRPSRQAGSLEDKARELRGVIDWLQVDKKARYRAGAGNTFCNIYAYDYCYLSNVYLPRVWWTPQAIVDLTAGRTVGVHYGQTVRELNANSLYDWLEDFGPQFGWRRVTGQEHAQNAANRGEVALICAQRTDLNRSGHICAISPEKPPDSVADRRHGSVHLPLQSQAGTKNFTYSFGTTRWWADSKFRAFGFWVHA